MGLQLDQTMNKEHIKKKQISEKLSKQKLGYSVNLSVNRVIKNCVLRKFRPVSSKLKAFEWIDVWSNRESL